MNGSGLRGFSGASGGNGGQDSPTNHPVVQLRRLDNDQRVTLLSDPASEVTSTALISGTLPPFGSGHVLVTVIINGVPAAVGIIPAPAPGIVVEQPVAFAIADGGSRSFAATTATPGVLAFTVKNSGSVNLTGLALTKDGTNAADFTVTASPAATVAPGGSTIFTVALRPDDDGREDRRPPPRQQHSREKPP